ncbi:hypothetical protein Msi02_29610 [Microbispora siamensis]|uniref:Uncharacterized protein n=1 Tax=Microbispora siamensis TaxID=564413 RepID=A0ABQ4GL86_9ACTN|nr:hypothetical protein Msi02_29610 [Microbispora siamensis]
MLAVRQPLSAPTWAKPITSFPSSAPPPDEPPLPPLLLLQPAIVRAVAPARISAEILFNTVGILSNC